jgi:hypothetical protein
MFPDLNVTLLFLFSFLGLFYPLVFPGHGFLHASTSGAAYDSF